MPQYHRSFFSISISEQQQKHLNQHKHKHKHQSHSHSLAISVTAIATGLLLLLTALFFLIRLLRFRRLQNKTCTSLSLDQSRDLHVFSYTCSEDQACASRKNIRRLHRFSYRELKRATNSFHESQKLGKGGYGVVYRGLLPNGKEVAVKKLVLSSAQGEREFQNELSICRRLDSRYIVKLLGFSSHGEKVRLLVYECMKNRSLQEALLEKTLTATTGASSSVPLLDWQRRFNIILDIARALAYLHLECNPPVIHGDVKPSNVLLDGELCGYLADFGLARVKISNSDQIGVEIQSSDLQHGSNKVRSDPSEEADTLGGVLLQTAIKAPNVRTSEVMEKTKQTKVVPDRAIAMANVNNTHDSAAAAAAGDLSLPSSYLGSPDIRGGDNGNVIAASHSLKTVGSLYSAEQASMASPYSGEEVAMVYPHSAEKASIASPHLDIKTRVLTPSETENGLTASLSEKAAMASQSEKASRASVAGNDSMTSLAEKVAIATADVSLTAPGSPNLDESPWIQSHTRDHVARFAGDGQVKILSPSEKTIASPSVKTAIGSPSPEATAVASASLEDRVTGLPSEKAAIASADLSSLVTPLDSPNYNLQELSPSSLSPRTDYQYHIPAGAGMMPSLPPRRSRTISPQKGSAMSGGRDWWWKQEHSDELKVKDYVMEWMRSELSASESNRSRDAKMQDSMVGMEQKPKAKQHQTMAMAMVEEERARVKKRKEMKQEQRKRSRKAVVRSAMAVQELSEGAEKGGGGGEGEEEEEGEEEGMESDVRRRRAEQRARSGNGGSRGNNHHHHHHHHQSGRKSREWWKDEYFAELSRKQQQKQKKKKEEQELEQEEGLHSCAEEDGGGGGGRGGGACPILSTVADRLVSRLREAGAAARSSDRRRPENIPRRPAAAGESSLVTARPAGGEYSTTETAASDDVSSTTTTTTSMRGTVCYVAPEFGGGGGGAGAVSEASDIYSFGVLLLVIISGRRPIELTPSPPISTLGVSGSGSGSGPVSAQNGGGTGSSSPTLLMRRFERANLISWARSLAYSGNVLDLVDDRLHGSFPRDQAQLCIALALSCIRRLPSSRPSISGILKVLLGEAPPPPAAPLEFFSPSPPSRLSVSAHHSPSPCHRDASFVSSIEDMV